MKVTVCFIEVTCPVRIIGVKHTSIEDTGTEDASIDNTYIKKIYTKGTYSKLLVLIVLVPSNTWECTCNPFKIWKKKVLN